MKDSTLIYPFYSHYYTLPYITLPYPTLLYFTLLYSTRLYSTLLYPSLLCPILPYPTLLMHCTEMHRSAPHPMPYRTVPYPLPVGDLYHIIASCTALYRTVPHCSARLRCYLGCYTVRGLYCPVHPRREGRTPVVLAYVSGTTCYSALHILNTPSYRVLESGLIRSTRHTT